MRSIASDAKNESIYTDVEFSSQLQLYTNFFELIKNEVQNVEMKQFVDSKIDLDLLLEFGKNNKLKKESVLAIDLGGSGLKVSRIEIQHDAFGHPTFKACDSEIFSYEKEINLEKIKWNDWAAIKVKHYAKKHNHSKLLDLNSDSTFGSLTFSFKIRQESVSFATVEACSKNFKFSQCGLYNVNIVEELNNSLIKEGVNLTISCVVNDVVATFATGIALGYENPIGVIIGTGTNAGFIIHKNEKSMIVNSEWGFTKFSSDLVDCISKDVIDNLDSGSLPFEVLVSGFKFLHIVKETTKLFFPNSNLIEMINWKLIDAFYYGSYENDDDKNHFANFYRENENFVKCVVKIVFSFKSRCCKIIAPMIVAAAHNKDFTVFTNGSFISKDMEILTQEIERYLKQSSLNIKVLDSFSENNASLYGASFISLASKSINSNE